jgi:hypothetical protein
MSGNCHFQIKCLDNPEYKKDGWMWEVVRAKQKAHLVKTALEEESRGTLNIMIFLKINHLPIL